LQSQANPNESLTDGVGLRRFAGWVSRSCHAVVADLELADSRSLEVLLYCPEDLAIRGEVPERAIDRIGDR